MNEQENNANGAIASNSPTTALSKQDTISNAGFNALNLFDEKQLMAAENFLKRMITTDKGGIKNVNEGLAIMMRAQDLGLPFSSCIEHIHVIQGKTGVDVHIIRSLLSRAGVTWECTKDYAPQYQYTDGNTIYNETQLPEYCVKCRTAKEAEEKTNNDTIGVYPVKWYQDLKGNIYNEFQVNEKCAIAINKTQAMKLANEGKFPIIRVPAVPIDFVTEYKFTRRKNICGEKVVVNATGHFSYSEAQTADLFTKDTYKKYARIMIANRAFTLGAREIADDVIFGVMETSELKLVTDTPLDGSEFIDAEVIN
jgi:hypothetical protein